MNQPSSFASFQKVFLFILVAATGLGCGSKDQPTFEENVMAVFAPCNEEELVLGAGSHSMQLVFDACGSNEFKDFTWSPNGKQLYIRGENGPWINRPDTREFFPLPLGKPISDAVWLNEQFLAVAVEGSKGVEIAYYAVDLRLLNILGLRLVEPQALSRGTQEDEVLFLARASAQDPRLVYSMNLNTAVVSPAFDFLPKTDISSLSYRPEHDFLCVGTPEGKRHITRCYQGADGTLLHTFEGKTRATISYDGKLIALEGPGTPLKNAATPEEEEALPNWIPKETIPESIWIHERTSGLEVEYENIYGHDVQWYDAQNYWISFLLWGIDGKQTNGNVVVGDISTILRSKGLDMSEAGAHPREDSGKKKPR